MGEGTVSDRGRFTDWFSGFICNMRLKEGTGQQARLAELVGNGLVIEFRDSRSGTA